MLVYAFCTFELLSCIHSILYGFLIKLLLFFFFTCLLFVVYTTIKINSNQYYRSIITCSFPYAFGVCDGVNIIIKLCVSCSVDQLDAIQ